MKEIDLKNVKKYISENIELVNKKRREGIDSIILDNLLSIRNPNSYKPMDILGAHQIIKYSLDECVSKIDHRIIEEWMKYLVLYIIKNVFESKKSDNEIFDIEIFRSNKHYQIKFLLVPERDITNGYDNFLDKLSDNLKHMSVKEPTFPILGFCYGNSESLNYQNLRILFGNEFWEFISGSKTIFHEIIEPLDRTLRIMDDSLYNAYVNKTTRLFRQFVEKYCSKDGAINLNMLVDTYYSALDPGAFSGDLCF